MEQWTAWDRKEEKLLQLLSEGHPDDRVYVYWRPKDKIVTPAILIACTPFEDLFEFLRDEYGEQWYRVMIRRRKEMQLRHDIGVAVPFNHFPRRDIRTEIEKLRHAKRKNDADADF